MAIKIEFYQLITPVHIAKKYFPKQYENESCWNDGVICTPMGTMNSFDISSIIRECERLGLRRFKEENGERIIGDYYIGTQSGLDDTFQYKKSNLIRVYNGVAWNPSCPLTLSKILCKWKRDSVISLFLYLDSVFKHKHKLIHNQAPVMNRLCPFLLNLHK